jgi:hypothetical protein
MFEDGFSVLNQQIDNIFDHVEMRVASVILHDEEADVTQSKKDTIESTAALRNDEIGTVSRRDEVIFYASNNLYSRIFTIFNNQISMREKILNHRLQEKKRNHDNLLKMKSISLMVSQQKLFKIIILLHYLNNYPIQVHLKQKTPNFLKKNKHPKMFLQILLFQYLANHVVGKFINAGSE